jgi:hypothetical protein|tara:strand:+ start:529 stop:1668 length:1140 start_codon:yes stop_codon:yes gene_type:complete
MLQFKSIKKIALTIVSIIAPLGLVNANPIGTIEEFTGASKLERNNETFIVSPSSIPEVLLYDVAETANGRMLIEFLDEAELALTENTKVYIDEVIYDPDPNKSKMNIRFAMGTARFASGKLAMVNKSNIDIRTPVSTIAIRGTDFTTTVDELGRSLVILLPDEYGDASGEITVTNEAGTVVLNEAYQATMVSTINSTPTKPVAIQNITVNQINNMFIVNPPTEIREQIEDSAETNVDQGVLDVDFLEFNELETDYLAESEELEFSELDIDFLDVDFLTDLLDVVEELERTTVSLADAQAAGAGGKFNLKGATIGFNKDSQFNIFEQDDRLIFYRDVNGSIRISVLQDASVSLTARVEGYEGTIDLNSGGDIIIVINQSN